MNISGATEKSRTAVYQPEARHFRRLHQEYVLFQEIERQPLYELRLHTRWRR